MEQEYDFRLAQEPDAPRIWEIIQQAKAQMYREKKQQWDETYPMPEHISCDIAHAFAYVLCEGEIVIAYGAVIFGIEPAYAAIRGKWLSEQPYVVLHRLAVAEEVKRKGIAGIFMQKVEELSIEKGISSFKVDTNFDNYYMQKLLVKRGFVYCGEIDYQRGERMAYEKLLSVVL